MHALEHCITDATSARAVARALGRNHIWMGYGVSWSEFPDRLVLTAVRGHVKVPIDITSRFLLLCPCDACMPENRKMIKAYKCT